MEKEKRRSDVLSSRPSAEDHLHGLLVHHVRWLIDLQVAAEHLGSDSALQRPWIVPLVLQAADTHETDLHCLRHQFSLRLLSHHAGPDVLWGALSRVLANSQLGHRLHVYRLRTSTLCLLHDRLHMPTRAGTGLPGHCHRWSSSWWNCAPCWHCSARHLFGHLILCALCLRCINHYQVD